MMIYIMRTFFLAGGIILLFLDFLFYTKRRMSDNYGLIWIIFSAILIILGALPKVWTAVTHIDADFLIPMTIAMFVLIFAVFLLTSSLSVLSMENRELAMHVSLLNQENEMILEDLYQRREKHDGGQTKNPVCDQHTGDGGSRGSAAGPAAETPEKEI